jgi:hypothetical protein
LGTEIGAVVRDYNGLIIERDAKGNVKSFKADDLTPTIKEKNEKKFGKRTEDGLKLVGSKGVKDDFSDQIKESNGRMKQWQREQKSAQRV